LAAWRYFTPATDLDDGGVSGIKITSNTLAVTKLVPGSEGQIVKVVGGVATWAAAAAGATFQEDFVFATNNFDFPSATGTTNVDIPITLPASREWKDVEIILSGNLLITNFGIITFNLQWNTAPETGSVAITSAGGCGRNTWTATGTSALGTTFPFELRWKGIVPASIKATNITIRLNFVGSTFLVSSNSRYEICARATANV
jgi:hypothetical protein